MNTNISIEINEKIKLAIKTKLMDLGVYVDDELPDYIMVMVLNHKTQEQMNDDLNLFLGNSTEKFTVWLHALLTKLESITDAHSASLKPLDKEVAGSSNVNVPDLLMKPMSERNYNVHETPGSENHLKGFRQIEPSQCNIDLRKDHPIKELDKSKTCDSSLKVSDRNSEFNSKGKIISDRSSVKEICADKFSAKRKCTDKFESLDKERIPSLNFTSRQSEERICLDKTKSELVDAAEVDFSNKRLKLDSGKSNICKQSAKYKKSEKSTDTVKLVHITEESNELKGISQVANWTNTEKGKPSNNKMSNNKTLADKSLSLNNSSCKVIGDSAMKLSISVKNDIKLNEDNSSPFEEPEINIQEKDDFDEPEQDEDSKVAERLLERPSMSLKRRCVSIVQPTVVTDKSFVGGTSLRASRKSKSDNPPKVVSNVGVEARLRKSYSGERPTRFSTIGAILKHDVDENEEYDPLNPAVGKVASVIRVTERKSSVPVSMQATRSLLFKAVTAAQKSIENRAIKIPRYESSRNADNTDSHQVKSRLGGDSKTVINYLDRNSLDDFDILDDERVVETYTEDDVLNEDSRIFEHVNKRIVQHRIPESSLDTLQDAQLHQKFVVTLGDFKFPGVQSLNDDYSVNGADNEELITDAVRSHAEKPAEPLIGTVKPQRPGVNPLMINLEEDDADMTASLSSTNLMLNEKTAKTNERCQFWPNCGNGDLCTFVHPSTHCKFFPICQFGDKCLYVHPTCKFDSNCTRSNCPYVHTTLKSSESKSNQSKAVSKSYLDKKRLLTQTNTTKQKCKFFPKCTNMNCPYVHPGLCHYGISCLNKATCIFQHPQLPSKDQFVWKAPNAPE